MNEGNESVPARPETPPPVPPPQAGVDFSKSNVVDLLLRSPTTLMERLDGAEAARNLALLAAVAFAGHFVYGLVVASFARGMQWWASPLKILAGMSVTGAICFPSLYILVCMSGARARATQVAGMLLALLALSAVFLAGFAPIAWVFSQSSTLVSFIGPVHLLTWFISIFASARVLFLGMKHWGARRTEGAGLWILVLLVTALQMATVLRPIVGPSTQFLQNERLFFLQHWVRTVAGEAKGD